MGRRASATDWRSRQLGYRLAVLTTRCLLEARSLTVAAVSVEPRVDDPPAASRSRWLSRISIAAACPTW